MIVKEERRELMRRNLEEYRRIKEDRRIESKPVDEDRRIAARRKADVEKLQNDNPEFTMPIEP